MDSFSAPGVESSAVHGTQHDKSSTPQGTDGIEAETTQGTGTEPGQPKRRKLTSEVWNEFHKEFIGGRWQAQCMYCKKWLSAASTGGTTHLNNHLKTCCAKSAPVGLKQQKLRLAAASGGKVELDNNGVFDQDVARKNLALMICVHEYPLSMVDHSIFRIFCASMQPLFKVVSRNTIRKDILLMHSAQKEKMVKYFANFKQRVAVTSDLWTAGHQKKGYMVVTAHFIDESFNLKSIILRYVSLKRSFFVSL